jgi:hypothetical protein
MSASVENGFLRETRFLCVTQSQLSWGLTTFLDFVHSSLYVRKYGSSVCVMQWTEVIRDGTLIEKGI